MKRCKLITIYHLAVHTAVMQMIKKTGKLMPMYIKIRKLGMTILIEKDLKVSYSVCARVYVRVRV